MTAVKEQQLPSEDKRQDIDQSSTPSGSQILYEAPQNGQEYSPPLTLDLVYKLCKVTIFHWSFGLILIPVFKTLFEIQLSFYNPIFFLCFFQIFICVLFKALSWLFSEPRSKKPINWSEQVIVITGGSHGLGLLLAQSFAIKRATVAILDIKEPPSKEMGFYYYECDVGNPKAVAEALRELKDEIGTPTILLNNAGIIRPGLLVNSNVVDIEKTIKVNLLGSIWTTKIVLPWMLKEDMGFIVNISSVLGVSSPAQACAYNASKAGLIAFHETIHHEIYSCHKSSNIKTLLVIPGQIQTGMFDGVKYNFPRIFTPAEPLEIVQNIMFYLENHVSGVFGIPAYTYAAPLYQFLPLSIRSYVYDKVGANDALTSWKGHQEGDKTNKTNTKDFQPTAIFSESL